MKVEALLENISQLGIKTVIGVPDSTLKEFCYSVSSGSSLFSHYVVPNEGSAVGVAVGVYLATQTPACVYMQNSGIGNAVNPVTSIANAEVYDIPIFFVIGYRGAPGLKDEPQHKFMGRITEQMLDCLEIEYSIVDNNTTQLELEKLFHRISDVLSNKKQFALVVRQGAFDEGVAFGYTNNYSLVREDVIAGIIGALNKDDLIVSTTGKISREVYEQANIILGNTKQCFLTVGGMGHASMIAMGIAKNRPDKRIICLDGDGAVLMHMGGVAFIAKQDASTSNMIHICLNNESHESVGGMPTAAVNFPYAEVAGKCGYPNFYKVRNADEFAGFIKELPKMNGLAFVEVQISIFSRSDLGRPKETALENAHNFIENLRY